MQEQQFSNNNISEKGTDLPKTALVNSVAKLLLITDNEVFASYFARAIQHAEFDSDPVSLVQFHYSDLPSIDFSQFTEKVMFHIDATALNMDQLAAIFKSIGGDRKEHRPHLTLWGQNLWESFTPSFFVEYSIADIRNVTCHDENWIVYVIGLSIRNYIENEKVRLLKQNLEQTIAERTDSLTKLNKKLQGALVMNSNINTKFHQQRLQIEQQNKEITSRNDELEKAFKKSSAQHIKLQKALYLNERQREELERVIAEANLINNQLSAQNEEIKSQKEFIEAQNEEIQAHADMVMKQHDLIKEQQEEIQDNIQYAKHIQTALLPPNDFVDQLLPSHFIYNRPKDVVSGDFYWISQNKTKTVVAVADCTGHGISGAMMSMLGTAFLNEIVNNNSITSATDILSQLRGRIISSLHQRIDGNIELSRDGMDIVIVIIDIIDNTLEFAGANNPMYLFRNHELIEFKPDKMPIGIHEFCHEPFHSQSIELQPNDMCYLFSDGYADQFGGTSGKKLKYKSFKEILTKIHQLPMVKQQYELEKAFLAWKNTHDQIDDVLVFGFRIE